MAQHMAVGLGRTEASVYTIPKHTVVDTGVDALSTLSAL